jgi:hypothetical protein
MWYSMLFDFFAVKDILFMLSSIPENVLSNHTAMGHTMAWKKIPLESDAAAPSLEGPRMVWVFPAVGKRLSDLVIVRNMSEFARIRSCTGRWGEEGVLMLF